MLAERLAERYARALFEDESSGPSVEEIVGDAKLQVERLIAIGFHHEVGKKEADYRRDFMIPEGINQPPHYKGVFDTFLVVDPRVALATQSELARIRGWEELMIDAVNVPLNPYGVWVGRYTTHPDRLREIEELVYGDLEGGSVRELVGFAIQLPDALVGRATRAMGAQDLTDFSDHLIFKNPADNIPYMIGQSIGSGWRGNAHMGDFGLYRGRQIVDLGR